VATTTILLVRHGETDWNRNRRVQGHTDVPLNETGRQQARTLAMELADEKLAAVYSSDLARAHETAIIVAGSRSLPVSMLPGLREKHFGTWEGLTDAEVLIRFPDAHETGWGDGETTEEMTDRVLATVREIAAANPGACVLVVTHGGPMRAVLRHCEAESGRIANCHVVRLTAEDGLPLRVH
jgi:2,3-bisphosphoglycerate-dependent phosphoglycerate mutase